MPRLPPRTPKPRETGPLNQAELQEIYDIIRNAEPHTLLSNIQMHF